MCIKGCPPDLDEPEGCPPLPTQQGTPLEDLVTQKQVQSNPLGGDSRRQENMIARKTLRRLPIERIQRKCRLANIGRTLCNNIRIGRTPCNSKTTHPTPEFSTREYVLPLPESRSLQTKKPQSCVPGDGPCPNPGGGRPGGGSIRSFLLPFHFITNCSHLRLETFAAASREGSSRNSASSSSLPRNKGVRRRTISYRLLRIHRGALQCQIYRYQKRRSFKTNLSV